MAKSKKSQSKPKLTTVTNRRARFDYDLGDELVVGVALNGPEVRAVRDGHVQLKGAYVVVRDGELWLQNASFSLSNNQHGKSESRTVDTTPRKLLAHKREIAQLTEARKTGMTIVPTKLLPTKRYIKLVIALGRGKKNYDKRQTIRQRDVEREHARQIKIHG